MSKNMPHATGKIAEQAETADSTPQYDPFTTNVWTRIITQPLMLAILVTSLFTALIVVLGTAMPEDPWSLILPLCFFVALESIYTSFWLHHPNQRLLSKISYRAAEITLLLVINRVYTWIVTGTLPNVEIIRELQLNPFAIFDRYFVISTVLILLIWQQAASFSHIFERLAIGEGEAGYFRLPPAARRNRIDRPPPLNRRELVQVFFWKWIWGGVFLALFTALSTLDVTDFVQAQTFTFGAITRLGLRPELLIALIAYFLTGFWLLSQGRLAVMNVRWMVEGVSKQEGVEETWRWRSLVVLATIAIVAAFLPIGSTLAIGRILGIVVDAIVRLLTLFLLSLLSLFGRQSGRPILPSFPPPDLVNEAQAREPSPPNPDAEALVGVFFWSIMATIAIFAILFYLRERGHTFDAKILRQLWAVIKQWWRRLRYGVALQLSQIRPLRRLSANDNGEEAGKSGFSWPSLRLGRLSPREQIRFFYLSLVRRAGERGLKRPSSATPREYADDLKQKWPDAEADVDALTDAFHTARYSPRPIKKEEASFSKRVWQRIRRKLKHLTSGSISEN